MTLWRRLGRLGWLLGGLGLLCIVATVLLTADADAADTTPQQINFQGRLTDAAGVPITGNKDLYFRYFATSTGGAALYEEARTAGTANPVVVTQGNYSVALGGGTRFGGTEATFRDVIANRSTVYLELEVVGEPAPMTPRVRILAAGYAINADLLDGLEATAFVLRAGDTMSGALTVQGNLSWGLAGTRTETRDDAGAMGGQSGYYQTAAPAPASSWPTGAGGWWHLLDVRHSNITNNFAMQFAGGFGDQDLWFRKTNDSASTGWQKIQGVGTVANVVTVQSRTIVTFTAPISGDGTAIAPLTLVITPQKAGNKIILDWVVNGEFTTGWDGVYIVTRNGVRLADTTDGANNRWAGITAGPYDANNSSTPDNPVVKIIDTNSLAVASTYELRVRSSNGTAQTLYLNRCVAGAAVGQDSYETSISTGMAMEIWQ